MAEVTVELKIADFEQFRVLTEGVAAALDLFGELGEDQRESLPAEVRDGIGALRRACEKCLDEGSSATAAAELRQRDVYHGYVILEWPAPVTTLTFPRAMVAWKVAVFDAADGTPVPSADRIIVRASADGWVTAELHALLGPDGMPAKPGPRDPVTGRAGDMVLDRDEDGRPRTGVFRYLVSEMRVRQPVAVCACGVRHPEGYECLIKAALPAVQPEGVGESARSCGPGCENCDCR